MKNLEIDLNHKVSKRTNIKLFYFVILSILSASLAFANSAISPPVSSIRYVKPIAVGLGDGSDWDNASGNLQAMIDSSKVGETVWVAGGIYKPSKYPTSSTGGATTRDYAFILKDSVSVYGSFAGTEILMSERTSVTMLANQSILDGDINETPVSTDDVHHVVLSINDSKMTLLDGFIIRNGNANGAGSITVETKTINRTTGAGILGNLSFAKITNCSITKNIGSTFGGGAYFTSAAPTFTNCVFSENGATNGAGMYLTSAGSYAILNSVFSQNIATTNGGAIYSSGNTGKTTNAVFLTNSAQKGGGMFISSTADTLVNCTFYNNAASTSGGAITNSGSTTNTKIKNSVFWNNKKASNATVSGADLVNESSGKAVVSNSSMQLAASLANYPSTPSFTFTGSNLFNNDPVFFNAANPIGTDLIWGSSDDGLMLQSCSPLMDYGNNADNSTMKDINGADRIFNTTIDLGAYENQFGAISVSMTSSPDISKMTQGTSVTFTAVALNAGVSATYDFRINNVTAQNTTANTLTTSALNDGDSVKVYSTYLSCVDSSEALSAAIYTIRYVKPTATGFGDGSSWDNASGNLQQMINASNPSTLDEVWVAKGTYKPSGYPTNSSAIAGTLSTRDYAFILKNQVKVYGSFAGNEQYLAERTKSVIAANPTILSGDINNTPTNLNDDVYHVLLSVLDDNTTILDGFTITKGNANGNTDKLTVEGNDIDKRRGGGMSLHTSSPTITQCIFTSNTTSHMGGGFYNFTSSPFISYCSFESNNSSQDGGAIYNLTSSNPEISQSSFSNNTSTYGGAGIFNASSVNPIISFCTFTSNVANTYGGGINNAAASPKILNCIFTNNSAVSGGGGIFNLQNSSQIINCLFNSNNTERGAAIYNSAASPVIKNATFFKNTSSIAGGAIYNKEYTSTSVVMNSIFWDNRIGVSNFAAGSDIFNDNSASATVTKTSLQLDNISSNYPSGSFTHTGNLYQTDPFFVTSSSPIGTDGIWRTPDDGLILQNCSPLIGIGINADNTEPKDISDSTRIHNTTIDLGAYENQYGPISVALTRVPNESYICVGESVIFTATPTNVGLSPIYDFLLNNVSVQKGSSSTYTTTTLIHADQIKVILTSQACSSTSNTITMTVHAPVLTISSNTPICTEKPFNLMVSNSILNNDSTYSWTGSAFPFVGKDSVQNPSFASANVGMSGNYSVTVMDVFGCTTTASTVVLVNPLPTPTATSNSPVCAEKLLTLSSSNTRNANGNFYSWTGPAFPSGSPGTDQEINFPSATVAMSGTYSVTITDLNGCTATTSTPVVVNSLPIPEAFNDSPVCAEKALDLFSKDSRAPVDDSFGPYTYAWFGNAFPSLSKETLQNPSFASAQVAWTGNYSVTITDLNGCIATATTSVLVNSLPIPVATSNSPVCAEQPLNFSLIDSRDPDVEPYKYIWTGPAFPALPEDSLVNPQFPSATLAMNGNYSVTMTDVNGCTATTSTSVIVNTLPIPLATSNSPVCAEQLLSFGVVDSRVVSPLTGTPPNFQPYKYLWTGPAFPSLPQDTLVNPQFPSASLAMNGNYSVTMTDVNGCMATTSTSVIVNSLPIPVATSNSPVCAEQLLSFNVVDNRTVPGFTGGSPTFAPYKYLWSGTAFTSHPEDTLANPQFPSALVSWTGSYSVTMTDVNGCTATTSTSVIVNSLPIPVASSNSPVCAEQPLNFTLIDSRDPDVEPYKYLWTGPAFPALPEDTLVNPQFPSASLAMNGNYSVTMTDVNGCTATTSTSVIVNSLPIPIATSNTPVCAEQLLSFEVIDNRVVPTLVGTPPSFEPYKYLWSGPAFPLLPQDTLANPQFESAAVSMTGSYSVTMTDVHGCTATTSTSVIVNSLPIPEPSSSSPICAEQLLSFNVVDNRTVPVFTGGVPSFEPYKYLWSGNAFTSHPEDTLANPQFPSALVSWTGSYSVTMTDVNGCTATTSTSVIVNSLPVPVAIYNDDPVCVGRSIGFSVSDSRGSGDPESPYSYLWTGSAFAEVTLPAQEVLKNPIITNASEAMSGKHYVTITDQYSCSASTSLDIVVHSLPIATASSNSPVCSAETLNLYASDSRTNQVSPYSYLWTGPNEFTSNDQNPIFNSVSVSLTGIYSIAIRDNFGCTSTTSTEVINHHPIATASNDGPYDESEDVNLLATGGTRFAWAGPNGFSSNLVNPTIPNAKTVNAGIYTVTVTFEYCTATATTPVNIACNTPAMVYYLAYSDGNPEIISPLANNLQVQISSRPMTILAIPACTLPIIESAKLHMSGTTNPHYYEDNELPFRLHELNGAISGEVLAPNLYTFLSTGFSQDNLEGDTITGPEVMQFWLVNKEIVNGINIRVINPPTLSSTNICAGSSLTLNTTSAGTYSPGNIYQAFLSDENGLFGNPILIGSSSDPSAINCTIPNYVKGGVNYKVMVRSSAPVVSSAISVVNLSIAPAALSLTSPNNNLANVNVTRQAIFTIDAANKITGTSKVIYKAQYNVTLTAGFEANNGTVFLAEIGSCEEDR